MYKVYIEDNVVVFSVRPVGDPSFVTFRPAAGEPLSVTKLLQKVQNSKRLAVVSDDIEQVFADFRASQRFIEAGGGVTADPQGNLLLIFRNGRWDLPKGKLEPGERIEDCAVREVGEECGLSGLQLGAFVAHTYHCYRMHGEWVLKRTSWYRMRYGGSQRPQPQTVEGSTEAVWVPQAELAPKLENTYFTIRDVLTAAGYVK